MNYHVLLEKDQIPGHLLKFFEPVGGRTGIRVNSHPTVKPRSLMRWLVRLVTPKGGLVLDNYCGSGSTLHSAVEEGLRFTGIERDPRFHALATKRMEIVCNQAQEQKNQEDLFDLMLGLE